MPSTKLGLALSGGGFRATFFHLGLIRCLRDYGRLRDVDTITSVSGGSIVAAHLVLNWEKFNGTESEFNDAAEKLADLSETDFRNREARLIGWRTLFGKHVGDTSSGAERVYADTLFQDRTIADLVGVSADPSPKLFILGTDLNNPTCTVSFAFDGIRFHGNSETDHLNVTAPSIATAVTASSAFPPFFTPINLDADETGANEGQLPHQPIFVTDGGVRDNSGANVLREVASHCDKLIVSDASRALDLDRRTDYSRSRTKTLLRVIDILQTRVADEVFASRQDKEGLPSQRQADDPNGHAQSSPPELWIRISDRINAEICSSELQNDISAIRTDLDSFHPGERAALYHFGYALSAQSELQPKRNAPTDRLSPFSDAFANVIPKRLKSSRDVQFKWLGRDFATLLNATAVCALGLVLALFGIAMCGAAKNHFYPPNSTSQSGVASDEGIGDSPIEDSTTEPSEWIGEIETNRLNLFDYHSRKSPHGNWKDAWAAANSGLFAAMANPRRDKVHCVYAGGGTGKGLFINVAKKKIGEDQFSVLKFDRNVSDRLKTLSEATIDRQVESKDYLKVSGFKEPFRLPAPSIEQFKAMRSALNGHKGPFLIDGLDEIHPDSSRRVISLLFDELKASPAKPAFLFARPESFWFYFSKNESSQPKAEFYYLTPPQDFYPDSAGQLLADLQEYKATEVSQVFMALLQELIEKSEIVRASVGITSLRNFVLETLSADPKWKQYSVGLTGEQVNQLESDFKHKAYGAILDYNKISHGRPSPSGNASQVRLYETILRSIAVKYSSPDNIDEKGWFTPTSGNTLRVLDPNTSQPIEVDVSAFLRFSGFVEVDPTYIKSPRFRFSPAWMHKYLIERTSNH